MMTIRIKKRQFVLILVSFMLLEITCLHKTFFKTEQFIFKYNWEVFFLFCSAFLPDDDTFVELQNIAI